MAIQRSELFAVAKAKLGPDPTVAASRQQQVIPTSDRAGAVATMSRLVARSSGSIQAVQKGNGVTFQQVSLSRHGAAEIALVQHDSNNEET